MPSLLVWLGMNRDAVGDNHIPQATLVAFVTGAVLSFTTVWWSVRRVPELPLSATEIAELFTHAPQALAPHSLKFASHQSNAAHRCANCGG